MLGKARLNGLGDVWTCLGTGLEPSWAILGGSRVGVGMSGGSLGAALGRLEDFLGLSEIFPRRCEAEQPRKQRH